MSDRSFPDTNILVYTDDHGAPEKQAKALNLIERCRTHELGVVSTQILQEYYVTSTRKLTLLPDTAKPTVELFSRFELASIRFEDVLSAIDLHRSDQISFWDALVIRAALRSGCSVLYSEDLQAKRKFGELEVVNPFR